MRRLWLGAAGIVGSLVLAVPHQASAALPSLQLAPLEVRQTLKPGRVLNGYIDVANPGPGTLDLETQVQGFKQADDSGSLSFFDSPRLREAITIELPAFTLEGRSALRMAYSVDTRKLPEGGAYAALFVRTASGPGVQSAVRVGTLLILQVGNGSRQGSLTRLDVPPVSLGNGIVADGRYRNTNTAGNAVAYEPKLTASTQPAGRPSTLTGPFVFPGNERPFTAMLKGAYLGPQRVTVAQSDGSSRSAWTFAITGYWRLVVVLVLWLVLTGFALRALKRRAS